MLFGVVCAKWKYSLKVVRLFGRITVALKSTTLFTIRIASPLFNYKSPFSPAHTLNRAFFTGCQMLFAGENSDQRLAFFPSASVREKVISVPANVSCTFYFGNAFYVQYLDCTGSWRSILQQSVLETIELTPGWSTTHLKIGVSKFLVITQGEAIITLHDGNEKPRRNQLVMVHKGCPGLLKNVRSMYTWGGVLAFKALFYGVGYFCACNFQRDSIYLLLAGAWRERTGLDNTAPVASLLTKRSIVVVLFGIDFSRLVLHF